jgi:hypothetical protein
MVKLDRIWIERGLSGSGENEAIRIDWDNDRHQRIEIKGNEPKDLIKALDFAVRLLKSETIDKEI